VRARFLAAAAARRASIAGRSPGATKAGVAVEAAAGGGGSSKTSSASSGACSMCHCSVTVLARFFTLAVSRLLSMRLRSSSLITVTAAAGAALLEDAPAPGTALVADEMATWSVLEAAPDAEALPARVRRPAVSLSTSKTQSSFLALLLALASLIPDGCRDGWCHGAAGGGTGSRGSCTSLVGRFSAKVEHFLVVDEGRWGLG
jgi:hypothetical protein